MGSLVKLVHIVHDMMHESCDVHGRCGLLTSYAAFAFNALPFAHANIDQAEEAINTLTTDLPPVESHVSQSCARVGMSKEMYDSASFKSQGVVSFARLLYAEKYRCRLSVHSLTRLHANSHCITCILFCFLTSHLVT